MTGTTLDDYTDRYARRVRGMTASEIRALFAVASRPEVVSLAGGAPYIAALPLDAVGEMLGRLGAEHGTTTLQYGIGQGTLELRERICEVMALSGIDAACGASPEDVVVTVGGQQALDLVARLFLDPGDVVLAEGPTYVGALGVFQAAQAQVVHVPMDDDGLIPEALETAIADQARAGRRVKFLYTIPTYQNPAGVTLTEERRERVLDICERAGLLVVEDDPYGQLGFEGEAPAPLRARRREGVFYLSTFSKTFAPGSAGRLDPRPARRTGQAGDRQRGADPLPERVRAGRRHHLPRHHALARAAEGLPGGLPGAARRDARRAGGPDAGRDQVDHPGRRPVRLGHPARRAGREGDDAAGHRRPGGVRARHRLLRGRQRHRPHAAQLLLPARRSGSGRGSAGWPA